MKRLLPPPGKLLTLEGEASVRKFWNSKIQIVEYILFRGEQEILRGELRKK